MFSAPRWRRNGRLPQHLEEAGSPRSTYLALGVDADRVRHFSPTVAMFDVQSPVPTMDGHGDDDGRHAMEFAGAKPSHPQSWLGLKCSNYLVLMPDVGR